MSLIGPRPTLRYQVERYDERQRHRLEREARASPAGRRSTAARELPWAERIELDLWYVEHRSAGRRPADPAADAARALRRHLQGRDAVAGVRLADGRARARGDLRLRRRGRALERRPLPARRRLRRAPTTSPTPTGSSRAATSPRRHSAASTTPRPATTRSPAAPSGSPSRLGSTPTPRCARRWSLNVALARSGRCCSSRRSRVELWPGRRRIALGAAAFVAFLPVVVESRGDVPPRDALAVPLDARALALRPHASRTRATRARSGSRSAPPSSCAPSRSGPSPRSRWRCSPAAAGASLVVVRRPRRAHPVALVHPPAAHLRRAARPSRSRPRGSAAAPTARSSRSTSAGRWLLPRPGLPDVVTRPTGRTSPTSRSRRPTTASGATTSASGPGMRGNPRAGTGARVVPPPARRHATGSSSSRSSACCRRCSRSSAGLRFARASLRRPRRLAGRAAAAARRSLGYLYFAVSYPTPDGDLLKASYMLTTARLGDRFGYALDRLRGQALAR